VKADASNVRAVWRLSGTDLLQWPDQVAGREVALSAGLNTATARSSASGEAGEAEGEGFPSHPRSQSGAADEARTRGCAAPAFPGCALVEAGIGISDVGCGTAPVKLERRTRDSVVAFLKSSALEEFPPALPLRVRGVLNLPQNGLRLVGVGLPLRHYALEVHPLGRCKEIPPAHAPQP
jgi:hypothetical protein